MPRKGLGASDAEIARYVFDKRRGLMERLAALTAPACAGRCQRKTETDSGTAVTQLVARAVRFAACKL